MKYVIYSRKSSEEKTRQVQSIEGQITEMKKIAARNNLSIVRIFREEKSAKKPGRKIFGEMIEFIEQGKANAILCWKLDRLARNPADEGMVKWMLQQDIIKQIKTNDRDYKPDDNVLLSSVEFGMANQYILDLSKNVKRGNLTKLEKGGWPSRAPLGYENQNGAIVADRARVKYIRKAFELYATGGYSLKAISDILFAEGFRSRGAGLKCAKGVIHKILHNPFYCGIMDMHGKQYPGNHEAIISKVLFDKAQIVLQGKHRSKQKKLFFALRGFLKCEVCGCLLTATLKKGHRYYYCTNGKGNCEEHKHYFKEKELAEKLAASLKSLKFNPRLIEIAYKAAKEKTNHDKSYLVAARDNLAKELKLSEAKINRLLDGYLSSDVPSEAYKTKTKELEKEKTGLEIQLREIETKLEKGFATLERTKKVFLEANNAAIEFLEARDERKRKLLEILLWNATWKNREMAKVSYKMPYQYLADEPDKDDFCKMWTILDSNQ